MRRLLGYRRELIAILVLTILATIALLISPMDWQSTSTLSAGTVALLFLGGLIGTVQCLKFAFRMKPRWTRAGISLLSIGAYVTTAISGSLIYDGYREGPCFFEGRSPWCTGTPRIITEMGPAVLGLIVVLVLVWKVNRRKPEELR